MAKAGRPTTYKPEYVEAAEDYIKYCTDTYKRKHRYHPIRLSVMLPTHEGFALYLGVSVKSLYNWADANPKFLQALEDIKLVQKEKLISSGLSGEYNSTIAKLVLATNHGMSDKIETKLSGAVEHSVSPETKDQIAQALKDML